MIGKGEITVSGFGWRKCEISRTSPEKLLQHALGKVLFCMSWSYPIINIQRKTTTRISGARNIESN